MDASSRFYFFHRGGCSCDGDKAKMMMISLSIVELLYPKGNPSFKNFPPCLGHRSNIIDLKFFHVGGVPMSVRNHLILFLKVVSFHHLIC